MATDKNAKQDEAARAPTEYEALVNIDHTGDGCIYPTGSVIRLDHLTPERIERLIGLGYVKPVKRPVGPPVPAE
jgi:hypothetical protein